MSAHTHSEGPWSAARAAGHLRVNDRFGMLICKVAQTRRNAAADLRLLAAAPDLLAALEAMVRAHEDESVLDVDDLHAARAAIAKARGTP